jgi:diacylglycerol kinase (ATP)
MRRAVLLFNPSSGRRPHKRLQIINEIAATLHPTLSAEIIPTQAPGTAGAQAAEACQSGAEIVFVCGGDGTIHEVIQGMAFQPHAALGIIPLGSANALARHLKLPLDPVQAALIQVTRDSRTIPLGQVTYQSPTGEQSSYFLIMAGAGPDGALVRSSLHSKKQRLGRAAYYLRAAELFLTRRGFSPLFAPYLTECTLTNGDVIVRHTTGLMAVRVGDLGGLFSPLVRGADIEHAHLHVTLIKSPAGVALFSWFAASWTRTSRWNPFIETCEATAVRCNVGSNQPIDVQADGEWLGETPMTLRLIPNALRILLP